MRNEPSTILEILEPDVRVLGRLYCRGRHLCDPHGFMADCTMSGLFGDDYVDPEDEEEEIRAAERRAERSKKTPEQLADETRRNAVGISVVPDGEEGEAMLRRLARSHVEASIATLAHIQEHGVKDAARNTAAKELLARGFGAVMRKSEQKVDVKITDQRAAHFEVLQELAKSNPALDIQDAEFDEVEPEPPRQITRRGRKNE